MELDDVQWMNKLAARDNIMYGPHSYIPIVLEDIPKYITLVDYEENCIKDVQTIGSIRNDDTTSQLYLQSITSNLNMEFPIRLRDRIYELPLQEFQFQEHTPSVVNDGDTFRVFGTLRNRNGVVMLDNCQLVALEYPFDSLRVLSLQSRLARRQYKQFYRTPKLDELLHSELGIMDRKNHF